MTIEALIVEAMRASEAGSSDVAVYQDLPILKAKRRKNGDTEITIGLVTDLLTPADVIGDDPPRSFLVIGRQSFFNALLARD